MPGCDILYVSPQKKGCVNNGKLPATCYLQRWRTETVQ